jgi:hypothetical protein
MRNKSDGTLNRGATPGGSLGANVDGELSDDSLEFVVGGLARAWVDGVHSAPVALPVDALPPSLRPHVMSTL